MKTHKRIAILGGGPSGLFIYKRFTEARRTDLSITIFEKNDRLGAGMPYSTDGANDEHVTNVSDNEIPEIVTSISEWIKTVPKDTLDKFHIVRDNFNEYKVLPRLLFGQYLTDQFNLLLQKAKENGIETEVLFNTRVNDIIDYPEQELVVIKCDSGETHEFDVVIICTGHRWPPQHEGKVPGWFDSPYPPAKLGFEVNHPVAIKGASLTAIDALRTLSRHNGEYYKGDNSCLCYKLYDESAGCKLVMHSRNGLLPAVRFHLEDSHLGKDTVLSPEEITKVRAANDGFLPLDYVFEQNFKESFKEKRPTFYKHIKDMQMEEFVDAMMAMREHVEPFKLLEVEYAEAAESIKQRQSVYWKEMLAVLSFAMNYPAKYFSAEDMLRVQKTLMPLISIVIAFVPQSSVEEMLALHRTGVLELIHVGDDSEVEPGETGGAIYHYTDASGKKQGIHYQTFVDCVGQPHLNYEQLPYKSLLEKRTVSRAQLQFRDAETGLAEMNNENKKVKTDGKGRYYLQVPGIAINDNFEVVDEYGALNERIFMMAVPYIGGYNPDYSGLDFGEAASALVAKTILNS